MNSKRISTHFLGTVASLADPTLVMHRKAIREYNAVSKRHGTNKPKRIVVRARLGANAPDLKWFYQNRKATGRVNPYQYVSLAHGDRFDIYLYDR